MKELMKNPTAKVAMRKGVLKKYKVDNQDVYFLKDKSEFEIELFNPLQETILCKISYNGAKFNDEGLVLKPGERVFLERYLETNNKFVFETYEVEDTEESKFAINKNGLVKVTFYKEIQLYVHHENSWIQPNIFYYDSCSSPNYINDLTYTTSISSVTTSASYDSSINKEIKNIETGRIEKGNQSQQSFTYVNNNFSKMSFHTEDFRLLPDSYKPKTSEDLKHKQYCTQCGKRSKVNDKFCSGCGNKL